MIPKIVQRIETGPGPALATALHEAGDMTQWWMDRAREAATEIRQLCLTPEEKAALEALGFAWTEYAALPVQHPDDSHDFRAMIHRCQEMIMARPVHRHLQAMQPLVLVDMDGGKPKQHTV